MEAVPLLILGQCLQFLFSFAGLAATIPIGILEVPRVPLPLIWPLLLSYGLMLYPGWQQWWPMTLSAVGAIFICTVPLWFPQPQALHHPEGWVLESQEDGGLLDTGHENISAYDFTQAKQLWREGKTIDSRQSAAQRKKSEATPATGPILIYRWGNREFRIFER